MRPARTGSPVNEGGDDRPVNIHFNRREPRGDMEVVAIDVR